MKIEVRDIRNNYEFTPESEEALAILANAGIPLGNQTVLLKGINDSLDTMEELMYLLVKNSAASP